MMRSTFELTSDWKAFISWSKAWSLLLTDVLVVTDKLEVEDVKDLEDLVDSSEVFAFLLVVVAISAGGALFD